MELSFTLHMKANKARLQEFADALQQISDEIGFKVSARGWCYELETQRLINKNQFDKVETWINRCRREGYLPVDFVAEEDGRKFSGIEHPEDVSLERYMKHFIKSPLECWEHYTPDWWEDEEYYIQMLVEKIDLKTLFSPVVEQYKIPIATSKGWSSILQRAEYAKRFKQASDDGKICVLLYCGDHDPDGLRISEFLRSNLKDIENVKWEDGTEGYNPDDLIIERFGLNYDVIEKLKLTWIDNLITGNKTKEMSLADTTHKNHYMPYVQEYLKKIGERKCEANAIITKPTHARALCTKAIESYLGKNAHLRFEARRAALEEESNEILDRYDLRTKIQEALDSMD